MSEVKWLCQECSTEVPEEADACPACKCESFVTGGVKVESGWNCGCDSPKLKMMFHMDGTQRYQSTYQCETCGVTISTDNKRSPESMMYWDEGEM